MAQPSAYVAGLNGCMPPHELNISATPPTGDVMQAPLSSPCPPEAHGATHSAYDPGTGHCYYGFAPRRDPWPTAETACEGIGGYLAVIDSAEENAIVRSALPPTLSPWIGFNDITSEAGTNPFAFSKVTGGLLTYNGFDPREPNNSNDEDCVAMGTDFVPNGSLSWNDASCSGLLPFVCEVTDKPCGNGVPNPGEQCDDGNEDNGDGCEANCTLPGDATPTPTDTPPPTLPPPTPTPRPNGSACDSPSECASAVCDDGICCDRACDLPNEFCTLPGIEGTCVAAALPTATTATAVSPTATTPQAPAATATPMATITSIPKPCVGDCNHDRRVTIDELVKGVSISIGVLPISTCHQFDASGDGEVAINELVAAVADAVYGCGVAPPTAPPSNTATFGPARTRTPTHPTATRAPTRTPTREPAPCPCEPNLGEVWCRTASCVELDCCFHVGGQCNQPCNTSAATFRDNTVGVAPEGVGYGGTTGTFGTCEIGVRWYSDGSTVVLVQGPLYLVARATSLNLAEVIASFHDLDRLSDIARAHGQLLLSYNSLDVELDEPVFVVTPCADDTCGGCVLFRGRGPFGNVRVGQTGLTPSKVAAIRAAAERVARP